MARLKASQPISNASGLAPDHAAKLEGLLREVERALSRDFLLGGSVANPLREVERELRNRLASPDALEAKAERLLAAVRDCYWMKNDDPIQQAVAEMIG